MLANLSELAVRQAEHRWAVDEHRKHNVGLMRQLSCYEQPFLFVDISEPGERPMKWCISFPSHVAAMRATAALQVALTVPVHNLLPAYSVMSSSWSLRAHCSADFWLSMCCGPPSARAASTSTQPLFLACTARQAAPALSLLKAHVQSAPPPAAVQPANPLLHATPSPRCRAWFQPRRQGIETIPSNVTLFSDKLLLTLSVNPDLPPLQLRSRPCLQSRSDLTALLAGAWRVLHMNYAAIERTHAQWSASMSELASFAAGRAATPFTGPALRNVLDVPAEAMVSCSQSAVVHLVLIWTVARERSGRPAFSGRTLGCRVACGMGYSPQECCHELRFRHMSALSVCLDSIVGSSGTGAGPDAELAFQDARSHVACADPSMSAVMS